MEKQVDALKSLQFSENQLPSIKDFISKGKLNLEIISKLERTEEKAKKADRIKIVYKGYNKTYDFRKYVFLVIILEIILLISIWITMNGTIWQSILKNLKPQDSNLKSVKEDVSNSAMALLKGRKMVFKTFESGVYSKLEQSEQSE